MKPLSRDDLLTFILAYAGVGKREEFYKESFRKIMAGERFSFNLVAAFWSFLWFLYHRLYFWGVIAMAVFFALDPITEHVFRTFCLLGPISGLIKGILPLAVAVVWVGCFGNYMLYNHLEQKVLSQWRHMGHDVPKDVFITHLQNKGGPKVWPIIVGVLVFMSISAWSLLSLYQTMERDPQALYQTLEKQLVNEIPSHCRGR